MSEWPFKEEFSGTMEFEIVHMSPSVDEIIELIEKDENNEQTESSLR